jgi:integrase
MIEDHLAQHVRAAPDALIFYQSRKPASISHEVPALLGADACKMSDIVGLHLHDLRRSGATWAATAGAPVRELMGRLGHTTPAVALRYQHTTLDRD